MTNEIKLTIKPCRRWRRVLDLSLRNDFITVSLRAPDRKGMLYTSLAFNSLRVSHCAVMFEPFERDEATLTVGQFDSTHFGMSRKDALRAVELFNLHHWTREPEQPERDFEESRTHA